MFGFTFGIISVEEKAHVWTVHRSYKKWGLPCGESQFTTTCSFDLRATWTPEVLTIRCQALLWRACKSVYHTPPPQPPMPKVIRPAVGRKDCIDPAAESLKREAPVQRNELRLSRHGVAGGLAGICEGHPGWISSCRGVCCPCTSGWVLGMFIAHSQLCSFHLLTNSSET